MKRINLISHSGSILVAALMASFVTGCRKAPAEAPKGKPGMGAAPVPVLAAKAVEKNVPVFLKAIGTVQPISRVTVRTRLTGQLTEVHFKEGQHVNAGDLLFTIDPRPFQSTLRQAEAAEERDQAQLANSRFEYERIKKLFETQVVSKGEYDRAEASFKALQASVAADKAAVNSARLNVEFTQVKAPISGRAGGLLAFAGNMVKAEEDNLVVIHQMAPIYVTFAVPERNLPEVRKAMARGAVPVEATYAGLASPERGEVSFMDNSVDPTTGTIQLKATFGNKAELLWPGQYVQVSIRLQELSKAVVVPFQAVQTSQKGEFVFVVKPDQKVEMRPVRLGLTQGAEAVIEQGLESGETVVTDGHLRLVPGATAVIKTGLTNAPAGSNAAGKPAESR